MITKPGFFVPNAKDSLITNKLKDLEKAGESKPSPQKLRELKKVSREFEALFLEKIWKEMKKTVSPDGIFHNPITEKYLGMFDWQFALTLSRDGGIGLGDFLYNQLRQQLEEKSTELPPLDNPPLKKHPSPLQTRHHYREEVEKLAKEIEKNRGTKALLNPLWPIPGDKDITSPFGWRRDPFLGDIRWHTGIDIGAPAGTPIRAIAGGKVIFSGYKKGYGNLVILKHKGGWESYYAHNEKNLVHQGEEIKPGEIIARVGSSGRATGPHLHLEVRRRGSPINPMDVFKKVMAHTITRRESS